jgi:hypothetical protein
MTIPVTFNGEEDRNGSVISPEFAFLPFSGDQLLKLVECSLICVTGATVLPSTT